ncbi:hypothetical protein [Actinopolymorpha alba]|uniref:hypothetical protein n=1 Tax=Actinopolymorpha alba TaxID=533267 RepID=UPI00036C72C8|nr:hypothetical protein [Actinopolymorpha alba]
MRTVARGPQRSVVAIVLAVLSAGLASGCNAGQSFEPSRLDSSDSTAEQTQSPTPTVTATPTTTAPTAQALDVCALVSASRVQEIFGRPKAPTVDKPTGRQDPGVPGMGPVYRCTYRWAPGQTSEIVKVSLTPDSGQPDAKAFVDTVLGPDHQQVDGAGDVAAINTKETFGHGLAAVVAASKNGNTVVGVMLLGPLDTKPEAFATLANEFLTKLR